MSSHIAQARDRLRGRRRAVIAAISICVVAVLAIVIATTGGSGSSASTDSPSTSTATVVIKRQDLVETDDEDGTLGYAGTRKVVNHLSGYVTWLPRQGSVIRPDHTLYSVDGTPVILLNGKLPTYRTLSSSVSGPDVRQLERNLRALGYDAGHDMTIDDTWTSATTVAVKRWQDVHGLSQTGSIELGRVVFQPGARRVSSLNATLGGSSSGSSGGGAVSGGAGASATTGEGASSLTTASSRASGVQAEAAVLRTAGATSTRTDGADQGTGTATEPAPEAKSPSPEKDQSGDGKSGSGNGKSKSKSNGASNGSGASNHGSSAASNGSTGASGASSGASSDAAAPANEIMTTTSTRKVVTVELATTKSNLAERGATVTVELPSGKTVHGRIASVGKVATSSSSGSTGGSSSSGSSTTPTITLTVRLFSKGTVLDQAPVTVGFEQNRVKNALSIPVTALLAQPGGKFAVEVVDGSDRRLVSVTPGAYTSGYVQISGAGLQPGMHVTNAEVR